MADAMTSSAGPEAQIMDIMAEGVKPRVLHALCRLGLIDRLMPQGTCKTVEQLAEEVEAHPEFLARLLRMAGQFGLLSERSDGYRLTDMGAVLAEDHPSKLKYMTMLWSNPIHSRSIGCLYQAVQSNKPGIKFAYSDEAEFFHLINSSPEEKPVFEKAMDAFTVAGQEAVLSYPDWDKHKKIVDVGGCRGTLLELVLSCHPTITTGINFDRPDVIADHPPVPTPLEGRLVHVGGDFFQRLPEEVHGADAIAMKFIMHDWTFDHCVAILKNCIQALAPGGCILVIDHLLPETCNVPPGTHNLMPFALDLYMMAVTGGCERSLSEWTAMFTAAGLSAPEVCCEANRLAVLRGKPRA